MMRDQQSFDESIVPGATYADLDQGRIERHLAYARSVDRYSGEARTLHDFLLEHHAVVNLDGTLMPTVAGLLVFGRYPQRLLPHASITVAHYAGHIANSGDVLHMHEYTGPVTDQIDATVKYLVDNMLHGYILRADKAQRLEQPQFPAIALRELTVNAVAHRDYAIDTSSVRIAMFRERIEWVNPGTLPAPVTIETIRHEQNARNKRLVRLLFQQSYVERFGQGLDTVFDECEHFGLPAPSMRETGMSFMIAIEGKTLLGASRGRNVLTEAQLQILAVLQTRDQMSAQDLVDVLSQTTPQARSLRSVQADLKELAERDLVARDGRGRSTVYGLKAR